MEFYKCKKYNCEFVFEEVGEEFKEVVLEDGTKSILRFVIVNAEGTAIINDWEFIGKMEHTKEGNIISKSKDIEVPERYYNAPCRCEHCNTSRKRNFTYIVRNVATNEFKQVGKSCLLDFTNGLSAEYAASIMNGIEELIEGESVNPSGNHRTYVRTKEMLLFFQETINHFGYVRNTYENGHHSTANMATRFYNAYHNVGGYWMKEANAEIRKEMEKIGFNHLNADVESKVNSALGWIKDQDENNNYMHNLKVACMNEYIPETGFALVASLLPTYDKNLEYEAIRKEKEEAAKREKKSEYVGNIGDRISFNIVSGRCLTSYNTQYGITYIYKFVDDNNNVYIWKTSKDIDFDYVVGKNVTGTIKDLSEYREIKQNVITRCKIK